MSPSCEASSLSAGSAEHAMGGECQFGHVEAVGTLIDAGLVCEGCAHGRVGTQFCIVGTSVFEITVVGGIHSRTKHFVDGHIMRARTMAGLATVLAIILACTGQVPLQ